MIKKIRLAALLMVLLCLSGCGNNNNVATSDADSVEEVANEQSDEISDAVDSPEPAEEESNESVEADESINADNETVDEDNEISEQNESESTDETKLEETVARTECNETVYTNATSKIRVQPSSSAEKVETVNKGTELLRTAILDNGWSEIQYNETTCYINSNLVDTENAVIEAAATNLNESVSNDANSNEAAPPDANANESTPAATTTQAAIGETKTFSNGVTFVNYGYTPKGLKMWRLDYDTGEFPEFLVTAYDATGITNDMSDYDKAVAINNYICKVVEYGYGQVDDRALTAECLDYGYAICVGYANAFDSLCTIAGVYTDEVSGMYNKGGHAWNYVLIGDTKYWVDVTANDTSNISYLMSTTLWADHTTFANY